jgi:hypothetical protein
MDLKHIKNDNSRKVGSYISLGTSGVVSFSKGTIDLLKAKNGTKIMFLQDQSRPKDWYFKINNEAENKLRGDETKLCFNAKSVCLKIRESLGIDNSKLLRIPVGLPFEHEGVQVYALLTAKIG